MAARRASLKPEERNEFEKWHIKKHAMPYYREMLLYNKHFKYFLWIALFSFLLSNGIVWVYTRMTGLPFGHEAFYHVTIISGFILMMLVTFIPICGDA
jgi:hypothetical protein